MKAVKAVYTVNDLLKAKVANAVNEGRQKVRSNSSIHCERGETEAFPPTIHCSVSINFYYPSSSSSSPSYPPRRLDAHRHGRAPEALGGLAWPRTLVIATNLGDRAAMVLALREQEFANYCQLASSDLGFRFQGLGEQEFGHFLEAPQCLVAECSLDPGRVLCQPLAGLGFTV
jgi:hypothetical protein